MKPYIYLKDVVTLRLDLEKCTGCGQCLMVCPHAVLVRADGRVSGAHAASASSPHPRRSAEVTPLSPDRYKYQLTIGGSTLEKLRLAKDMLRHALPSGDDEAILDAARAIARECDKALFEEQLQ